MKIIWLFQMIESRVLVECLITLLCLFFLEGEKDSPNQIHDLQLLAEQKDR
jgi:hypothetical protein